MVTNALRKPKPIDVLIIIDALTLAQTKPGGSFGQEQNLTTGSMPNPFMFIIAADTYLVSNQPEPFKLNLGTVPHDILRWTITSESADYSVILYNFACNKPKGGSPITAAIPVLTTPVMTNQAMTRYTPQNVEDPVNSLHLVTYQNYIWETVLLKPNIPCQYIWDFMIIDNANKIIGCYQWTPTITLR